VFDMILRINTIAKLVFAVR